MMKRTFVCLLLTAFVLACFCGCKKKADAETPTVSKLAEGEYEVYYLTQDGLHLDTEVRDAKGDTPEDLARTLMSIMQDPAEHGHNCAFGSGVSLQNLRIKEGTLELHLSREYNSLKSTREILARAAIVRTLAAVDGVDSVLIYVEDALFKDANGYTPGAMTAGDFELNFFENLAKARLKLFFADENGRELSEEVHEVSYGYGTTLYELVLKLLIEGPTQENHHAVLPADTEIRSINVNNGICYVLLSQNVLSSMDAQGIRPKTMVYAIVNSLTELTNINRVAIRFEGVDGEPFGEELSLIDPLERDLDMNKEEQNGE
ncbi:MAG: GerMN domain-containing protein [Lachnospiraceae bacterium]|nr:GerMN domain-containing protein [Lachnospiraceae bacterium]